jgi:RNA polymerase sigma-70 factor, ECF subfamily
VVDANEFDCLTRKHLSAVSAYARAIARDQWAAEDATSETFLRAWKYIDSFRGVGSFEGWLLHICRRCVIDQAARHRPTEELNEHTQRSDIGSAEGLTEMTDLLRTLPLPQREALVLCSVLGYTYEQVADLLDVPIGTVRSRVHRARATFDESLQQTQRDSA